MYMLIVYNSHHIRFQTDKKKQNRFSIDVNALHTTVGFLV